MFGHIAVWLGSHLSLWPAVGTAVLGAIWSLAVWCANPEDDEDSPMMLAVLGALLMIGALFASFATGEWAYWLPYLTGIAVLPSVLAIGKAYDSVVSWHLQRAEQLRELREQQQAETKRRAEEKAKSPAGIIARCEAVVKKYIDALPQDLAVIEERRQAETKLDALKALYGLVAAIEKLGPDDEKSFDRHLTESDALFADVSLEKECGALVRELRERSVQKAPPVLKIHAAIEALELSILSLPGKAAARIAEQVPTEYLVSSEDMAAEMGRPVLPVIDLTPEPLAPPSAPHRSPRKQLA